MSQPGAAKHDLLTAASLATLAFIAADLSHELLGHGSVAALEHARYITLSYTALSTDATGRVLVLAGPLVNLLLGLVAFAALRRRRFAPPADLFLFLFGSMSLLNLSSYLIFSGITNTGDLAVAVAGTSHLAAIRWAMDVIGLAGYIAATAIVGRLFSRYAEPRAPLATVAYAAPVLLNTAAALFSPLGLHYYLLSALPATAGVNAYLFLLPRIAQAAPSPGPQLLLARNLPWLLAGLLSALAFVLLLGPGLKLRA